MKDAAFFVGLDRISLPAARPAPVPLTGSPMGSTFPLPLLLRLASSALVSPDAAQRPVPFRAKERPALSGEPCKVSIGERVPYIATAAASASTTLPGRWGAALGLGSAIGASFWPDISRAAASALFSVVTSASA